MEATRDIDLATQGLDAGVHFVRIEGIGIRNATIRIHMAE
jgi:hypothetical protein